MRVFFSILIDLEKLAQPAEQDNPQSGGGFRAKHGVHWTERHFASPPPYTLQGGGPDVHVWQQCGPDVCSTVRNSEFSLGLMLPCSKATW